MGNFTVQRLYSFKLFFFVVLLGVTSPVALAFFGTDIVLCKIEANKSIVCANNFSLTRIAIFEFEATNNSLYGESVFKF
jgi:hypothetical protein